MTLNGHIENGKIILDEVVPLAEGMKVRVELYPAVSEPNGGSKEAVDEKSLPTLYERWKPLFGMIKDAPPDFAKNHDHYVHGQPKK